MSLITDIFMEVVYALAWLVLGFALCARHYEKHIAKVDHAEIDMDTPLPAFKDGKPRVYGNSHICYCGVSVGSCQCPKEEG